MATARVEPQAALTFVVIGGSVAGLAAALSLQQAGHQCNVLEASTSPRVVRALNPILSPPSIYSPRTSRVVVHAALLPI
jgi:glycine/D-amino acid oxidase-like deaminating enzyme